jgi:hypothetical protein
MADVLRGRLAAFGEHNRQHTAEKRAGHVFLVPGHDTYLVEIVESIPDRPATPDELAAIAGLMGFADADWTIEYHLPELLASLDPHGRAVAEIVVNHINDALMTSTVDALVGYSRFASRYSERSTAWRRIAVAACQRIEALRLGDEDRRRVYSSMLFNGVESWGGSPKDLHPRWQDAVDSAKKALDEETESVLRPFWQWRLENEQRQLEREKARLEERAWD